MLGAAAISTLTGFYIFYLFNALGNVFGGPFPNHVLLSRWFNATSGGEVIPARILERPPTAELRENQTDQDTLPPYDQLDRVLRGHVEEHLGPRRLAQRGFSEELVRRVLRLVVASEYKRRQAAPALRVTARAFGEGRLVCGVHNLSAVEAGRLNGSIVVAALHGSEAFRKDLEVVRKEVAAARKAGPAPDPQACAKEAEIVAKSPY